MTYRVPLARRLASTVQALDKAITQIGRDSEHDDGDAKALHRDLVAMRKRAWEMMIAAGKAAKAGGR